MRIFPIILISFLIACNSNKSQLEDSEDVLDPIKIYNGHHFKYKSDTVLVFQTDTSTIKIHISNNTKSIEEIFYNKDLVRHVDYFSDNKTIKEQCFWNKAGTSKVGIHKNFNKDGSLKLMIDFTNRTWKIGNKWQYPHYALLKEMKAQADSILASMYSKSFIETNLKWSMFNSYYFDNSYSQPSFTIEWFRDDSYEYTPSEFIVSYDLVLENTTEERFVQIIFDRKGKILKSHNWNDISEVYNIGLINNKAGHLIDLVLTPNLALDYVKKHNAGIDDKKLSASFQWTPNLGHESSIYNGKWEIYVLQHLYSQNCKSNIGGCKREYYKVYIFNPWNGKLLNQKKMFKEINYGSDWITTKGLINAN